MHDTNSIILAGVVLAGLVLVLLLAPRLMRSLGIDPVGRPGRRLSVVEAAAIDPRRRLVLARCDGREVLLLVSPTTDTVVGWLPQAAAPVSSVPEPPP